MVNLQVCRNVLNQDILNCIKKIVVLLIFSLSFFLSGNSFSQTLSGIVTDMSDHGAIANVIVRNKNGNELAYTDHSGKFSIGAQEGDSILFISQGYYTFQMIMPEGGSRYRQINLERKILSIHEIQVTPGWTPYQKDSIERHSRYRGALEQEKETSVFSPFTAIADNISKSARQRWRFQKNYVIWEKQKFIDTRYTREEVHQLTGLSGDSLAAFMNAYPIPYDYARTASDLEIKMWIKYNYREWMKHPIVPDLPEIDFSKEE